MKQLQDISLQGKKVLIRCDLNVPLDDNLKITDDNRIKQTLPTIKYALENGAKVIVMSHFEDPANSKPDPKLSLAPMAVRMAELLGVKVTLAPDCVGAAVEKLAAKNPQQLNWKVSIVDLLKLLGMDSSLKARKELAEELECPANLMDDSAEMNTWLHKTVLTKIAANGGNIPDNLLN